MSYTYIYYVWHPVKYRRSNDNGFAYKGGTVKTWAGTEGSNSKDISYVKRQIKRIEDNGDAVVLYAFAGGLPLVNKDPAFVKKHVLDKWK